MGKYGKKAQETIKEVMEKFKKGELKSGKNGKKVTNRKQAVAIGLSEAREKGAKVPKFLVSETTVDFALHARVVFAISSVLNRCVLRG